MGTTTSTRSHGHTFPDSGDDPWYTTFVSYAQSITDDLDNLGTTAISQIVDNATSAVICSFTHVASGCYLTFKNAAAGNGAEITVTSSATDEDIKLTPKGSGNLILDWATWPAADGTANQILSTNGSGTLTWQTLDITIDTSPTLGGDLDVAAYDIVSSGANHVNLTSANDIVLKLGDAAGAKKVRIKDSAGTEVASVDSDGLLTCVDLTVPTMTVTTLNMTNNLALSKVDIAGASTVSALEADDKIVIYDTSAAATKTIAKSNFNYGFLKAYAKIVTPGGTPTITGSNVSSITDIGTGIYDINFTTAMSSANYTAIYTVGNSGTSSKFGLLLDTAETTTAKFRIVTYVGSTLTDCGLLNVAVYE